MFHRLEELEWAQVVSPKPWFGLDPRSFAVLAVPDVHRTQNPKYCLCRDQSCVLPHHQNEQPMQFGRLQRPHWTLVESPKPWFDLNPRSCAALAVQVVFRPKTLSTAYVGIVPALRAGLLLWPSDGWELD